MNPLAEQDSASHPFRLQRLGVVMEPEPDNPTEAEGVLNPASACGRDGQLYLFPRLVARGNYSRITFIEPLPLLRHRGVKMEAGAITPGS